MEQIFEEAPDVIGYSLTIAAFLKGKDVFVVLPTGFGKLPVIATFLWHLICVII